MVQRFQRLMRVIAQIHQVVRDSAEGVQAAGRLPQRQWQKLRRDVERARAMTEELTTLTHVGVRGGDLQVLTHAVWQVSEQVDR